MLNEYIFLLCSSVVTSHAHSRRDLFLPCSWNPEVVSYCVQLVERDVTLNYCVTKTYIYRLIRGTEKTKLC